MSEVTEEQLEDIEALFVQTAGRLSSDGQSAITLHAVSPSTIYFADRPKREVGCLSLCRRFFIIPIASSSFWSGLLNVIWPNRLSISVLVTGKPT